MRRIAEFLVHQGEELRVGVAVTSLHLPTPVQQQQRGS